MRDGEKEKKRKQEKEKKKKKKRTSAAQSFDVWERKITAFGVGMFVCTCIQEKQMQYRNTDTVDFPTVADRSVWRQMGN